MSGLNPLVGTGRNPALSNLRSTNPTNSFVALEENARRMLGDDISVTKRMDGLYDGYPHTTTGLEYAINGRARLVTQEVGYHLAQFEDPIKAILGMTINNDATVVVTRKYVLGGAAQLTPARAPARTVAIQEDVRTVTMARYGADIELNLNLFLVPGQAEAELRMKVDAQKRELQLKLIHMGYKTLLTQGLQLTDAIIRSNPNSHKSPGQVARAAHQIYCAFICGQMNKSGVNAISTLVSGASNASAYANGTSDSSVMIIPHGAPQVMMGCIPTHTSYAVTGLKKTDDPIRMKLTNAFTMPGVDMKILVHYPHATYEHGLAHPNVSVASGGLTDYTWVISRHSANGEDDKYMADIENGGLIKLKAGVDIIRVTKAIASSAIIGRPGCGELLAGYPFSTVSTSGVSESMRIQLRVHLGSILIQPEDVIVLPNVFIEGIEEQLYFEIDTKTAITFDPSGDTKEEIQQFFKDGLVQVALDSTGKAFVETTRTLDIAQEAVVANYARSNTENGTKEEVVKWLEALGGEEDGSGKTTPAEVVAYMLDSDDVFGSPRRHMKDGATFDKRSRVQTPNNGEFGRLDHPVMYTQLLGAPQAYQDGRTKRKAGYDDTDSEDDSDSEDDADDGAQLRLNWEKLLNGVVNWFQGQSDKSVEDEAENAKLLLKYEFALANIDDEDVWKQRMETTRKNIGGKFADAENSDAIANRTNRAIARMDVAVAGAHSFVSDMDEWVYPKPPEPRKLFEPDKHRLASMRFKEQIDDFMRDFPFATGQQQAIDEALARFKLREMKEFDTILQFGDLQIEFGKAGGTQTRDQLVSKLYAADLDADPYLREKAVFETARDAVYTTFKPDGAEEDAVPAFLLKNEEIVSSVKTLKGLAKGGSNESLAYHQERYYTLATKVTDQKDVYAKFNVDAPPTEIFIEIDKTMKEYGEILQAWARTEGTPPMDLAMAMLASASTLAESEATDVVSGGGGGGVSASAAPADAAPAGTVNTKATDGVSNGAAAIVSPAPASPKRNVNATAVSGVSAASADAAPAGTVNAKATDGVSNGAAAIVAPTPVSSKRKAKTTAVSGGSAAAASTAPTDGGGSSDIVATVAPAVTGVAERAVVEEQLEEFRRALGITSTLNANQLDTLQNGDLTQMVKNMDESEVEYIRNLDLIDQRMEDIKINGIAISQSAARMINSVDKDLSKFLRMLRVRRDPKIRDGTDLDTTRIQGDPDGRDFGQRMLTANKRYIATLVQSQRNVPKETKKATVKLLENVGNAFKKDKDNELKPSVLSEYLRRGWNDFADGKVTDIDDIGEFKQYEHSSTPQDAIAETKKLLDEHIKKLPSLPKLAMNVHMCLQLAVASSESRKLYDFWFEKIELINNTIVAAGFTYAVRLHRLLASFEAADLVDALRSRDLYKDRFMRYEELCRGIVSAYSDVGIPTKAKASKATKDKATKAKWLEEQLEKPIKESDLSAFPVVAITNPWVNIKYKSAIKENAFSPDVWNEADAKGTIPTMMLDFSISIAMGRNQIIER